MKTRRIRPSKRLQEIVRILIKYGFEDFVKAIGLGGGLRLLKRLLSKRRLARTEEVSVWQHIREAFEELGPTFIKLGQVMSMRRDMLPEELVSELELLQDRVPSFSWDDARRILEEDLPKPMESIFSDLDEKPLASASIAQVHRGRLSSGEKVAVKIRRPEIARVVGADLGILQAVAILIERYLPNLNLLQPRDLVADFKRTITKELDLNRELLNAERLRQEMAGEEGLKIPKMYEELSSSRVLVMELIDAPKISEIATSERSTQAKNDLAVRISQLMLSQIFKHGFFHADPHPGNILVLADGSICFIDLGMMGVVSRGQRESLGKLMIGIDRSEASIVAAALLDISRSAESVDRAELTLACHRIVEDYATLPLEHFQMGGALSEIIDLLMEFRLSLPTNILYMMKAIATVEGIGAKLDPKHSILKSVKPFAADVLREEFSLKRLRDEALMSAMEYGKLVRNFPTDAQEVLDVVKRGRLKVDLGPGSLHSLRRIAEEASNTFTLGLISAALLISSSLIVHAGVSPKWLDVPIIGLIGYIISGLMGTGLLVTMILRALRK